MRLFELQRSVQFSLDGKAYCSVADVTVYSFILLIGAFQFTHYPHSADFMNDPSYPDMARSILERGSYEIRFLTETTFPPGFALILAAVGRFFGIRPATMFPVVAVSAAAALIASYELLRRIEGRNLAAATCVLLASSPALFGFNTTVIFPEVPYLMMSMFALLLALKIDHTDRGRAPIGWVLLLSVAIVVAVLIRSVGVALLAGLGTWIAMSLLIVPLIGWCRFRKFLIPLVLGLSAQVGWSIWAERHEVLEWELPGYPHSYISQVRVKDGHYPELGLARLRDFPARAKRNTLSRAAGLSQFLIRRNISRFWSSPATFGIILLITVGLASSLRKGGQLHDWYFLWYEIIFMFWPWDYRDRFLIPVVPLACLYLWRGAKALRNYSVRQPKVAGVGLVLFAGLLCISSAAFTFGIFTFPSNPEHIKGDHLQMIAATVIWGILAVIGFGMLQSHARDSLHEDSDWFAHLSRIVQSLSPVALRITAISVLSLIVLSSTARVIAMGRENLHPDMTKQSGYPMIVAANWIRSHEPSDRPIMAREPEFIFHFTGRRVVWFPPISNPEVLMEGIRRHHVAVIVVMHRLDNYWLPAEDACFQALQNSYPSAFDLVYWDLGTRVYEVAPPTDGQRHF
jgi:hypothetical protein